MKEGWLVRVRTLTVMACLVCAIAGCAAGRNDQPERPAPTTPWAPAVGASWQYQLQGEIDTSVDADVYILDLFDVDESVIEELHRAGRRVVCYVNAGAYEEWRPDASAFPEEIIGEPLRNWPGEFWLDIRRLEMLEPIMAERFDLCRDKGFDAVDPDNLNGYTQESGFQISPEDQLRFNRMLARLAHERSLGIGLKNDLEQVEELIADFDFAVNEDCVLEEECALLLPFIDEGKAVLHVEYRLPTAQFCPVTRPLGFSSIRKPLDLTAPREACADN
jgi:hypothetical protein